MSDYNYNSANAKATASVKGVGFSGLLFIALLVLKLTHVIDWSWWWITAPLWGSVVLFILFIVIWLLIIGFLDK